MFICFPPTGGFMSFPSDSSSPRNPRFNPTETFIPGSESRRTTRFGVLGGTAGIVLEIGGAVLIGATGDE
eukprot:TRINITY_DN4010_c0_g1_i1.p3 TRINITY_DN4010_c0_g1~~TRINITY_DN4010_c0_g1_i1.p3  ORF type:complete len:70 (+),score=8.18 TRINITY_DN4010_c0_g1_i1:306-515(+)